MQDKKKYSFIVTLRDIANAFPSMDQDEMDAAISVLTDEKTAAFLAARHGTMHVRIDTVTDGSIVVEPRTGGAQGDGVMPGVFRRTYEPMLDEWMQQKEAQTGAGVYA